MARIFTLLLLVLVVFGCGKQTSEEACDLGCLRPGDDPQVALKLCGVIPPQCEATGGTSTGGTATGGTSTGGTATGGQAMGGTFVGIGGGAAGEGGEGGATH